MEKHEMQIISQLMEELQNAMGHSEDDFSERLGRKKPEVEVVKMQGKLPMDGSMDGDMPMGDDDDMGPMDPDMDASPEDKLKKRLLALRGE